MLARIDRLAIAFGAVLFAWAAVPAFAGQPLIANKCCTNCGPSCHSCAPPPVNIGCPVDKVWVCDRPPVCRPSCPTCPLPPINICGPICDVKICKAPRPCAPSCHKWVPPCNIHPTCEPGLTCTPGCKH